MRSRFSAYSLGLVDYIMESSSHTPDRDLVVAFCENTQFRGLKITEHTPGPEEGFVTFEANLWQRGQDVGFTERSRFVKADGRWLYADGERQS